MAFRTTRADPRTQGFQFDTQARDQLWISDEAPQVWKSRRDGRPAARFVAWAKSPTLRRGPPPLRPRRSPIL